MLRRLRGWAERDPGLALALLGMLAAIALYAPTLGTDLVNYDDPWLYRDNHILHDVSMGTLGTIFGDFDPRVRFVLGSEYLPVRDVSVLLDFAIWGRHWGGFHFTNVALYVVALALLFRMLDAFGFDRTIVGLTVLVFAIHPAHAESVAWLSERKGLLGLVFAATTGFAYARYRAGGSARWLIGAMVATVLAVWSKAPAAFTIAALAGLELVQPVRRVSWRRSIGGLAAIAAVGAIAFVPVIVVALRTVVVGSDSTIPGSRPEVALGTLGFYLRLGAMAMPNALRYPISTLGPNALDLALGAAGMLGVIAALVPRVRAPVEVRAAAVIWMFAWLPVSHLVLPLRLIGVADRYALVLVLPIALAIATGIRKIPRLRLQIVAVVAIALAAIPRTLDAVGSWSDDLQLTARAVESSPSDGEGWALYAIALAEAGRGEESERAIEVGLQHVPEHPRLLERLALIQLSHGQTTEGVASMRRAAELGNSIAMASLALILLDLEQSDDALIWGRKAARTAPTSAHTQRSHGMAALATGHADEALEAFTAALELAPSDQGRYNKARALVQLDRIGEAIPLFEACTGDPKIRAMAQARLGELRGSPRRVP